MRRGAQRGAGSMLSARRQLFLRSPGVSAAGERDDLVSGIPTCSSTQNRGRGEGPREGAEEEHVVRGRGGGVGEISCEGTENTYPRPCPGSWHELLNPVTS